MSQSSQQLLNEALELPTPDRGRLAAALIASLDPECDADADQAWSAEISRRLQAVDAGQVQMIPWSEASARIRGTDGTAAD
jgi:putative addiction module component (TIGR02574 family)